MVPLARMTNILSDDKRQEVLALGRLGWTLRRIEGATGVRRETAGAYLKAAGLAVQAPGRWGHPAAKPAIEVSTDSGAHPPGIFSPLSAATPPGRAPAASACEPYRELIEAALGRPPRVESRRELPVALLVLHFPVPSIRSGLGTFMRFHPVVVRAKRT